MKPTRPSADFALAWLCVFVGLSLPFPRLPALYVHAHALLATYLSPLFELRVGFSWLEPTVSGSLPWVLTLLIRLPGLEKVASLPIDLRVLVYLPTICFVALAVATPLGSWRSNARLLIVGLLALEPLLLALVALPILSFLAGAGPSTGCHLSLGTNTLIQVVYRALLASPSMTYVLPLALWWGLLHLLRRPKFGGLSPNFARAP